MADEQPSMFVPTMAEIIAAVHSLCADELKPFGRVVLKRLREHAAAAEASAHGLPIESVDPESMPRIDPKQLRKLCEECQLLRVAPEEGKEYSAVPVDQTVNFVEVCDPQDPYDVKLWSSIAAHLDGMASTGLTLPCGRYACARALVAQQLPCLLGLSFGKVCHVVQLAISQRRLLGHREGRLVPFEASDECAKERCALQQQPFSSKKAEAATALPVASWEKTRACLQQLLLAADEKDAELPLSDVKRLFRRQFDVELNETALGYTRVFDLLQDPRLHDICTVHSQGNGQVSVRRVDEVRFWPAPAVGFRLPCVPGRLDAGDRVPQLPPLAMVRPKMPAEAVCLSTVPMPSASPASNLEHPTGVPPLSVCLANLPAWELVSPGASPRGELEKDSWCGMSYREECDVASTTADSCAGWGTTCASDEEEDEQRAFCLPIVKNTFINIAPASSLIGSARRRTQSEPRNVRAGAEQASAARAKVALQKSWAELSEEEFDEEC